MVNKSNKNITWKDKTLCLLGRELHEGEVAPAIRLVDENLADLTFDRFADSKIIISVLPSLDTSTCSLQSKRFNEEVKLLKNTVVLTVSLDLPFAQARWCQSEKCSEIIVASDYKYRSFGEDYGVYIQELGLLARAVFVLSTDRIIRHVEYVGNLSSEPDYQAALNALNAI